MTRIKRREDIILSSRIVNFYDPDFIYIPYEENDEVLVKNKQYVTINQLISKRKDLLFYSSISGTVNDIVSINTKKYIRIMNDYKENKSVSAYSFNDIIKEKKYKANYDKLIIRAVDKEPYIRNYEYLLNRNLVSLFDTIDDFSDKLKVNETILLLSDNYIELINKINTIIGSYPKINIRIISSNYPIIINDYDEKDNLNLSLFDIFEINKMLDEKIHADTTYISVVGNAINKSCVVNTKKYVALNEILQENFKIINNDSTLIVNGILSGEEIDYFNCPIDDELHAIFILNEECEEESPCINCGECVKNCPVHNNPSYIMKYPKKKSSKIAIKKCLHCNNCSYVCPAKINLSKYLGG